MSRWFRSILSSPETGSKSNVDNASPRRAFEGSGSPIGSGNLFTQQMSAGARRAEKLDSPCQSARRPGHEERRSLDERRIRTVELDGGREGGGNLQRVPGLTSKGSSRQSLDLNVLDERVDSVHLHSRIKFTTTLTVLRDAEGSKLINQYSKLRLLGRGSYSKVVLYRNQEGGSLFAIKSCSKSRLRRVRVYGNKTALTAIRTEIEVLRRVSHPNIVQLVEVIDAPDADKIYLVLEYAERGAAAVSPGVVERAERGVAGLGAERGVPPSSDCGGCMTEPEARAVIRDALSGLVFLHHHNIIHGDVKPDNVLVGGDGKAKLCDFTASTILGRDQTDIIRHSPGTPVYYAPECCTGEPYQGKPADAWALGVTIYVCLCGRYPFVGPTMEATLQKIMQSELQIPEGLSDSSKDLLLRLLCKDPEERISLREAAIHPWLLLDA